MNLYSYVVTHDYGFAPNPYGEVLTLATCKPDIRRTAQVGDWLMGTGSAGGVGQNKLVYLACISKIIPIVDYATAEEYKIKKPSKMKEPWSRRGDNIYRQNSSMAWTQLNNPFHGIDEMEHDLSGLNVLVCNDFWYFGKNAIEIPDEFSILIKKGPKYKKNTDLGEAVKFIKYVSAIPKGLHGSPSSLHDRT